MNADQLEIILAENQKRLEYPDTSDKVNNRYLVAVDIGGTRQTSDYHDIVVIDRYDLMFGGVHAIVAEWHGHAMT